MVIVDVQHLEGGNSSRDVELAIVGGAQLVALQVQLLQGSEVGSLKAGEVVVRQVNVLELGHAAGGERCQVRVGALKEHDVALDGDNIALHIATSIL